MKINLVISSLFLTLLLSGTASFAMEVDGSTKKTSVVKKYSKEEVENTSRFIREAYFLKNGEIKYFFDIASDVSSLAYTGSVSTVPLFEEYEKEVHGKVLSKLDGEWRNVPDVVSSHIREIYRKKIKENGSEWEAFYKRYMVFRDSPKEIRSKQEKEHWQLQAEIEQHLDTLRKRNSLFFKNNLKDFISSLLAETKIAMTLEELLPGAVPPVPAPAPVPVPVKEEKKPLLLLSEEDEDVKKTIKEVDDEWIAVTKLKYKNESVMNIGRNVATAHVPFIREYLPRLITLEDKTAITDIESVRAFLGNNLPPEINTALNKAKTVEDHIVILPAHGQAEGIRPRAFLIEVANLVKQIVSQNPKDEDAQLLKTILESKLEEQSSACSTGLVGRMFYVYFECFKYLTQFPAEEIKKRVAVVKEQGESLAKLEPKKH